MRVVSLPRAPFSLSLISEWKSDELGWSLFQICFDFRMVLTTQKLEDQNQLIVNTLWFCVFSVLVLMFFCCEDHPEIKTNLKEISSQFM